MGRTSRIRRKNRKKLLEQSIPDDFQDLETWMRTQGWSPTCSLTPHVFKNTGRGLRCLKPIESNEIIMRIPRNLLITTSSISSNQILEIFSRNEHHDGQSILAVFLCFEKHLGGDSSWKSYVRTLPHSYTVPDYCKKGETPLLPLFLLQDLQKQRRKVVSLWKKVAASIEASKIRGKSLCHHCGISLDKIIGFREFKWAFYTVNTRAVYIDASQNKNRDIAVLGDDNLALAPFLDLFNHSYEASVSVGLQNYGENEFYEIRTLKPFGSKDQVFINYGPHNNRKLCLEYGFVVPDNPLDEVFIDYSVVQEVLALSKTATEFIETNGFDRNIGFTAEGLNYHGTIVLFVVGGGEKKERWKEKIYRWDFDAGEVERINELGCRLVGVKRLDLMESLEKMDEVVGKSNSFGVVVCLVREYVRVLDRCLESLGC